MRHFLSHQLIMILTLGILVFLGWIGQSLAPTPPVDPILEFDVEDLRRPVWNVAHMVNALHQVDYYLDLGANSIEFDIAFNWEGVPKFTFHGVPCDCFRSCMHYENFDTYIEYMRRLTTPGDSLYREQLILLFMDFKLSGLSADARYQAGVNVARKMLDLYWKREDGKARAYVLLSIPSVTNMQFAEGFNRTLHLEGFPKYKNRVGVDFSGNEDLDAIHEALRLLNMKDHIWIGDGITNCLPRGTSRLREALFRRDGVGNNHIEKVYWWTVDRTSTMRSVFRLGADAMITNYPDRMMSVLQEQEFSSRFRLATFNDNPWKKYMPMTAALYDGRARGGNISEILLLNDSDELLYNC